MALGGERDVHVQTVKNDPSISKERQELDVNELGGCNIVEYTKKIIRELVPTVCLFLSIVLVKLLSFSSYTQH